MKFTRLQIGKLLHPEPGRVISLLRLSRKRVITILNVVVVFLFLVLAFWDGSIFYSSFQKKPLPSVERNPTRLVTANDIDAVIRILGARDKKFKEILEK